MKYGFGCAWSSIRRTASSSPRGRPAPASPSSTRTASCWKPGARSSPTDVGYQTTEQVAATAHGLYWSKEGDDEFLYWTENVAGRRTPKIGARVYKTDLKGKVLYTIGNVDKESSTSQKFDFINPTDVAVAANGDIYVVDGYGSQLLHRFDKNFKLIKTIGGPGKEHGKFNTCHGVWISTLKKEPEVYIADRANNRLEVYSLGAGVQADAPRLPHAVLLLPARRPALRSRAGRAGDDPRRRRQGGGRTWATAQGVKKDVREPHPDKFAAPHALTVASNGDLYVIEWVPFGRPRKFKPTPA